MRGMAQSWALPFFCLVWRRMLLLTCPCAFRLCRLAKRSSQSWRPDLWPGHFSRKFSHAKALVTCPCAFRSHRLAQNLRRDFFLILGPGIFPVYSGRKWLFCHATTALWLFLDFGPWHFSSKFLHKWALVTLALCMSIAQLAQNARLDLGPRLFCCQFPHKMDFVLFPCAFGLRGSCKLCVPILGCGLFPVNFRVTWFL